VSRIIKNNALANLPVEELESALREFLQPVLAQLPEQRLREVGVLAVRGILAAQSPVITEIARAGEREDEFTWPLTRRLYRLLWNPRFSHRHLLKGLYAIAQQAVARHSPPVLVVALDPVNFEKPYTHTLAGVSTVLKSTPPGPRGEKRLTSGYPAMTATVVNLPEPVMTYANWFSYKTSDFVSVSWELYRAIRTTRALFPQTKLRFVGDSELDNQQVFRWVQRVGAEFIFRVRHQDRLVEVYNQRLDRWEGEHLEDLTASVPFSLRLQVSFNHARRLRHVEVRLGWLKLRLPGQAQALWVLVAYDPDLGRQIALITNIAIETARDAEMVYTQWRYRPQIEHTYRFDQEQGLDVEDMRVRTLERMRRVFVLVLLATLFVYFLDHTWPRQAVLWLRRLGGKLGLAFDSDGPYILLAGISAVLVAVSALAFAARHPFPRPIGTYG